MTASAPDLSASVVDFVSPRMSLMELHTSSSGGTSNRLLTLITLQFFSRAVLGRYKSEFACPDCSTLCFI
ncbi:hypothetical protein GYMLUDRAFT_38614 [Collybiopsis luxurians FD-317 M1]|nr:hypothetical protein GYMLUDRAFT_38614 [Collybiopsis luxurians FD-317 M1]